MRRDTPSKTPRSGRYPTPSVASVFCQGEPTNVRLGRVPQAHTAGPGRVPVNEKRAGQVPDTFPQKSETKRVRSSRNRKGN